MSSSRRAQQAHADEGAERVLGIRKMGAGQQYEIKWRGVQETTWEAASRVRKKIPQLVQEFEQQQSQQQQQQQQQQQPAPSAEGATAGDEPMLSAVVAAAPADPAPGALQQSGMSLQQVQALEQLVREQAQQLRQQEQRHVAALQQLRASPAHSSQSSAHASPQRSPHQESRGLAAAAAAAAAAPEPQSRFARKEPRAQDLREYDGAAGAKLDTWLKELARAAELYELSARETVKFGVSRLQEAALDWWMDLSIDSKAAINCREALAAALRKRFQHITAATVAREQLDRLQQGSRHINEYIADFRRLRTQLSDMGEADALHAFVRGLRRDIAVELRKQRVQTVADAIELAAHVGSIAAGAAASTTQGRPAHANQMDTDDGDGSANRLDRIEAALNAMAARDNSGMGAKTQTHRGYAQERGRGGGRGGFQGGRGGRFGGRPAMGTPTIPGVPASVVEQRRAANQCYRCGSSEHQGRQCPNATSASQQGN